MFRRTKNVSDLQKMCQSRRLANSRIYHLPPQHTWIVIYYWFCSKGVKMFWQMFSISRFKTEAMRISRLMKDSPRTPVEKTADWIEYVLRHGGARHLRAQVFNIPWYQYYLLDVIACLVAIFTLVVMAIRLTCRFFGRVYSCQSSKTKNEWTLYFKSLLVVREENDLRFPCIACRTDGLAV